MGQTRSPCGHFRIWRGLPSADWRHSWKIYLRVYRPFVDVQPVGPVALERTQDGPARLLRLRRYETNQRRTPFRGSQLTPGKIFEAAEPRVAREDDPIDFESAGGRSLLQLAIMAFDGLGYVQEFVLGLPRTAILPTPRFARLPQLGFSAGSIIPYLRK